VVDTRYGHIESNASVVVKDGLIVAVSKIAVIATGSHVRVVNAGGKYLSPGLWDMNAHLSRGAVGDLGRQSVYTFYVANGVTGLRNMDAASAERPQANTDWQPEIEGAVPAWASRLEYTSEYQPLHKRRTIENLDEVFIACSVESAAGQDKMGAAVDQHGELSSSKIRETCRAEKADDLFVRIADHATWIVPSLVSRVVPDSNDNVLTIAPASLRQKSSLANEATSRQPGELDRDLDLVREMRRTGVQFLAGTNGPSVGSFPGTSLHRELELLVACGFTPFQALQAATFNPALYMAKLDKYGVIERGHIADMVLLDENPLEDIRNTNKVAAVILRGVYVSRTELNGRLTRAQDELKQADAANTAASRAAQ
jgi:imidazolonepropionase-like amidohydrolase